VLAVLALVVFGAVKVSAGLIGLSGHDREPVAVGASPSLHPSSSPSVTGPSVALSPGSAVASLPACAFGDAPAEAGDYDDGPRTILDSRFALPEDYSPTDLVTVDHAGFPPTGWRVREVALDDLADLGEAAENAGYPLNIAAAYRSYEDQADLFERREDEFGHQNALRRAARPGHSEHQLGTAVDFKALGENDVDIDFAGTPTGRWLEQNAWRFGFVESYPNGKQSLTCYLYEPWHYRYLGRDVASQIHASGLTVREYLWREAHPA